MRFSGQFCDKVAKAGSWETNRMYNIRESLLSSNEPAGKISVEKMSRGPFMSPGVRQPLIRAFIDDMAITTKTVVEGRWTLEELGEMMRWARMKFKPTKSRGLLLKSGKVKEERFKMGEEDIPTVSEKPINCLGKWYDDSLRDTENIIWVKKQLEEWMKDVDRCELPDSFNAWIFQHEALPRIL